MRIGLQLLISTPGGLSRRDALAQAVRTAVLADQLGFDVLWLSEHHRTALNVCPDPLTVLAHLAGVTEGIRLGTAIVNLPLHHPSFLAERAALVDNLSGGRLELGVGRGFAAADYQQAGIDQRQAWDLFETHHDQLVEAMTEAATAPCHQRPLPPIWLAVSGSERSLAFAARHGYGLLLAGPTARLRTSVDTYQRLWQQAQGGRSFEVGVSRAVHVADTREEAIAEISQHLHWYRDRMHELEPTVDPPPIRDIIDTFCIAGTPEDCVDQIDELRCASGLTMLNCVFGLGGMSADIVEPTMLRFADEILPAFRRSAATTG
ncbi:MAG TPA: LLM class flavin-dependent oxidoreductase [Acidimicrobiales bacterium]